MWPATPAGDPFGEIDPGPWPPFDMGSAIMRESLLDPAIDQAEAVRRAWVAYAATITNRKHEGRNAA